MQSSALRLLLWVIGLAVAVNLGTHPLLWWASDRVPGPVTLLVLEPSVVLVEALMAALALRRPYGWCLLVSTGTNAASLAAGIAVGLATVPR